MRGPMGDVYVVKEHCHYIGAILRFAVIYTMS